NQSSENIVYHDRHGKMAIFPDGMGSILSRCVQSFSISQIDQSHRQYRCDLKFDQLYVEEWPCCFICLSIEFGQFVKYVEISNAVSSGGDAVQHRPSNY